MTEDQRVVTNKGVLTVKELYQRQEKIQVAGREKIESASEMLLPRPDAPIVKILTKEGYSHKVTPDHKVWVKDFGWKEAQELEFGDKILTQQYEGMWGLGKNSDLAFLIGLCAGDGTFGGTNAFLDIWGDQQSHIPYIEEKVNHVLSCGKYSWDSNTNAREAKNVKFGDSIDGKSRLSSGALRQIFDGVGFSRETKLKVPEFIWKGNRETVAAYLEGIYFADATLSCSDEITTSSICSTSKSLLEELQILWANFGVKSTISEMDKEGWKFLPDGKGGEKEYWCKAKYRLFVTSVQGNKIVEEVTNISKYRENSEQWLSNLEKKGYKQKLYSTFIGLEKLDNEDAYCLSVDSEEHSWTVNGLITKNTEIILHNRHSTYENGKKTEVGETAVCNLSSINLARHMDENGKVDYDLLKDTINKIVRALDNVIDINFYPTEEARKANMLHRPVGMGCMGWFDVLVKNGIVYDSTESEDFVDNLMEFISYHAIDSSINLAEERGRYETYEGSLWDQGKLPIDTWRELAEWKGVQKGDEYAGQTAEWNLDAKMDWKPVREKLAKHGIRNSHVMAIAPNASIAYILGCEQSIEPMTRLIRPYKNKSGNIMISNSHFVDDMKKEGLWCPQLASAILEADGDVAELINIPDKYKELYKRAYDRDQFGLIRVNARRQKWIDQAISFNLYNNKTSKKFINDIYVYANKMGLKTTYYFRNEAATKTKVRQEGKTPTAAEIQACSIDAMMNGGSCEMCEG